ncbi:MAG TPA: hypothetical protein VM491_12480, partial [Burkholderiaceae bacterium]|nr:hypothetical protein [Burkholderiaceae bacterium]
MQAGLRIAVRRVGVMTVMRVAVVVRMAVVVPMAPIVPTVVERMDPPAVPLVVVLVMDVAVAVRARFRLEARDDPVHVTPEPLDHRLQHVIGQQPQPAVADLQRNVPVADVICDSRKLRRIVRMDLEHLLG